MVAFVHPGVGLIVCGARWPQVNVGIQDTLIRHCVRTVHVAAGKVRAELLVVVVFGSAVS